MHAGSKKAAPALGSVHMGGVQRFQVRCCQAALFRAQGRRCLGRQDEMKAFFFSFLISGNANLASVLLSL